ncbi:MAG TPA: hypothetical protein VF800_12035 [Telluria sp.]|jgi:hypothetical protein
MAALSSTNDFLLDIDAQLQRAARGLERIEEEFVKIQPGEDLSRIGRIETKEFVGALKHVLDQVTVRVWRTLIFPELSAKLAAKKMSVIYYPYAYDEQMFQSALGKMVSIEKIANNTQTPNEEIFATWLRAVQPLPPTPYSSLYTIGKLSRLPHQKLIEQKKSRRFIVEAFGPTGGGASMYFEDKPERFSIWTYEDEHQSCVGIGGPPTSNNPNAKITAFTFDPETMDFNTVAGAKTSVLEVMMCYVEDMKFDALKVFSEALWSAKHIVHISEEIMYCQRGHENSPTELGASQ